MLDNIPKLLTHFTDTQWQRCIHSFSCSHFHWWYLLTEVFPLQMHHLVSHCFHNMQIKFQCVNIFSNVYEILLDTCNTIHFCLLNDMECFFCVDAMLPLAARKRITFLSDITKKLHQISCLVVITVKWTSFELLVSSSAYLFWITFRAEKWWKDYVVHIRTMANCILFYFVYYVRQNSLLPFINK